MARQQLSPPNPLARLQRATYATWIVGGVAFIAALVWASRAGVTPQLPEVSHPGPAVLRVDGAGEADGTDGPGPGGDPLPGFARRFSPAPPPPEIAPTTPSGPAPEPILAQRLQLLGIAREGDALVAALYDPEDDRVHLVRDGDTLADVEVRQVAERTVTLARGARTRTISLHTPGTGGRSSKERRE